MNDLQNILAKPNESLTVHTADVIKLWEQLKLRYENDIENDEFWNLSLISVAFHDFGKIADNFQEVISGKVHNYDNYVRHEFISGMFLFANNYEFYRKNPLSLFAVLSHHKKLDSDLFLKESSINLKVQIHLAKEFLGWLINELNKKIDFSTNEIAVEYLINPYQKLLNDYKNRIYPLTKNISDNGRIDYINYKAILQISDWLASGKRILPHNLAYDSEFLKTGMQNSINSAMKAKNISPLKEIKFKRFQIQSDTNQNVIAIAPTGSGKTEAALLWAKNKSKNAKIIYLLPTKVTSNAIYERLKYYFGYENVAIVHSSAFFFRKDLSYDYDRKDYLLDKTFFRNITVCTIDQVLTQGFNLGYWELKTFHQRNAKIIIDEIHLYEPYTLGLILATIKYLQEHFNSSFYIMTATMPNALKYLLNKNLNNPLLIEDKELLNQARNIFTVKEKQIENDTDQIIKSATDSKKVLVVVNTVDAAISMYNKLKNKIDNVDTNILCYHSRFIVKHRQQKEREIYDLENSDKSGILIATQVVEVSLDIDFDILFTENAPIDAIIQRAGRVNRKRKKKNTKVIVYRHSEISEKWVYPSNNVLNKTWDILQENNGEKLTEEKLTELVNDVYANYDIEDDDDFKKGMSIHSEEQKKLSYIQDNSANDETMTRLNMDTINVIPMINHTTGENYEILLENASKLELSKHELSIRKSKEFKFRIERKGFYRFIDTYYDEELGLNFKKNPDKETVVL